MSFRVQPAAPARLNRCQLFGPGSRPELFAKMAASAADVINLDLEDSVSPADKDAARANVIAAIAEVDWGNKVLSVRINGLDTSWGADDARAALKMEADAILLPKVSTPEDLDALAEITGDTPLWAMMETALGMLNAVQIATHPQLQGMVMGTNDLAKELQTRSRADRLGLQTGLGLCLLAAKAQGLAIIDGVYNAFKDDTGLDAECQQGRDMGFDGKTLIHPAQIDIANAAFSPSEADVELARRQIEAFDAAEASGQGVAVVDGRIVENLHIVTARETLAKADAIAAMMEG